MAPRSARFILWTVYIAASLWTYFKCPILVCKQLVHLSAVSSLVLTFSFLLALEPGIASKFALPQVPPLIQKKCNEHRIAPIIVLNVSLPLSRPIMFGEALSRKCVTCVVFFIIKQSTLKILDEGESHPSFHSVNLWTKWCTQAATDKSMRERLKIIPFINNWDEANMPAGRTLQVRHCAQLVRPSI